MPLVHTTELPEGAKFSAKRAQRAIDFIEKFCVHTKSAWAGKPFTLMNWQKGSAWQDENGIWRCDGIIAPAFGTVRRSDLFDKYVRQYSLMWLEMARKQGKSELMAALGLYLLIADGEWSAENYSVASDREQAAMVFNVARDMVRLSKPLAKMEQQGLIEVVDSVKRIIYTPTMSTYKVIAADASGNLGANPHGILFDEVLTQPSRELWDYLDQGMGTRPQSIMIAVTTPGPDRESFAYTEHEVGLKVAQDPSEDPSRFAYIAYVDEAQDWENEDNWYDASPAMFHPERNPTGFFDIDQLRKEYTRARNSGDLAQLANFRIFRLGQWGNKSTRWLDMNVYDESEERAGTFTDEDLEGIWAVGGLDLAETTDLTSWQLVFPTPERVMVKPHFWITRKAMQTKHRKMLAKFMAWEEAGLLTVFDSDVQDYEVILRDILADIETYNVRALGYDQFQAPAIINAIEGRTDVTCVKIPQTTTRMNPGSKELVRLLGERKYTANRNPVMRWNAENANYKQDNELNIKPSKKESTDNIDGVTALVNALCVVVLEPEEPDPVFYFFEDDDL